MNYHKASIPEQVKHEVHKMDPEAEVVLFGSRARGDFNEDSDWDFLILLNRPVTWEVKECIWNKLYEIELEVEQVINCVIEEKSEWRKYRVLPLYENIENEGIGVS